MTTNSINQKHLRPHPPHLFIPNYHQSYRRAISINDWYPPQLNGRRLELGTEEGESREVKSSTFAIYYLIIFVSILVFG